MEFENNKLEWLEFDLLSDYPKVVGNVFLRHGGTSKGAFSFLNLSDSVGDHPDSVKVNKGLIKKALGVENLVFAKQQHGVNILEVTRDNLFKLEIADGLFTREKNIALAVTHADCQAAIFFDSENEIIGVVHAGWKGLLKNIYNKMVETLEMEGAKREDLIVCISPSLGPDHAEFKNYKTEFPKEFWDFQEEPFYFNLFEIARKQLRDAGVQEGNIEIIEDCTFCNAKDCYSFRRDRITGRHATVVALKE
jgi:YfiH family protein